MEVFWEQGPRGGTYAICEKKGSVSGVADTSEGVKALEYLSPDVGLRLCCSHCQGILK